MAFAFVTLVTSDAYLPGALVVASALRDVHPSPAQAPEVEFQTVCLVTPETVDVKTIKLLRRAFDVVVGVEVIAVDQSIGLELLGRPDLHTVLTKLHMLRLTQFEKVIFLDADVLPLQPLSHLFNLPHDFSAVPDVGWPDIFNSGVMVFTPGEDKFNQVMDVVRAKGSWDGGDQGVLNEWRGDNWHRLSFKYNTTPTAAYTYAPAYERFGSSISAIHFIGTNKPWLSIPYRAPSSQSSHPSSSTQQSYGYGNLVDRWFSVYDRHFRPIDIADSQQHKVQKYASAWNDEAGAEVSELLSLDELRRLAIEGIGSAGIVGQPASAGEGGYHTLPLEGRVDLIRPIPEPTVIELPSTPPRSLPQLVVQEPTPPIPLQLSRLRIAAAQEVRSDTLPTPLPHEIPPAPLQRTYSLPPVSPQVSPPAPPPEHGHHHGHHHPQPQHHHPQHHHLQHHPQPQHHHPQPQHHQPQPQHHVAQPQHHVPQDEHGSHHAAVPLRPSSPPKISWNPALEPPPNDPPPVSAFPIDTTFQNAWDQPQQNHRSMEEQREHRDQQFFLPLAAPQIPAQLLERKEYSAVISDAPQPQPDRSRVLTVFPWEEKPRSAPQRYFPRTDLPPPGLPFAKPAPPPQRTFDLPPFQTPTSPPSVRSPGMPMSLQYGNAWDQVPSIQKYATRLMRPDIRPSPAAVEVPSGGGRRRRHSEGYPLWEEVEQSSRDGDVEDGDSDSDQSTTTRTVSSSKDSDADRTLSSPSTSIAPPTVLSRVEKSRSRRGSRTGMGGFKDYRSQGTQTPIKELCERGVQAVRRKPRISPPTVLEDPLPLKPTLGEPQLLQTPVGPPSGVPAPSADFPGSGALSPRLHDSYAFGSANAGQDKPASRSGNASPSTKLASPVLASPVLASSVAARPKLQMLPSDDQVLSPASSDTATSPRASPSTRPAGRSWDPARGVDVFKRGSEEVLARFLRLDSWEESARRSSPPAV